MTVKILPNDLRGKYLDENNSTRDLAVAIGCSETTVRKYLKLYGIPTRISKAKEHVAVGKEVGKYCTGCNELLALSAYRKNIQTADGHSNTCRTCEAKKRSGKFDREKHRIRKQRRKAKLNNLIGTLTASDWSECLLFFGHSCAYCGCGGEMTQDHVIPIDSGGNYNKENIVPACKKCNSSKRNFEMQDWYKNQLFFSAERLGRIHEWCCLASKEQ